MQANAASADCSGGCFGTKGQVTILHAEGISQTLVKGDVVDSAYIDKADMFVTTIRRKDGKMFDVYVDSVGEIRGHNLIDSSTIYDPSVDDLTMVTFDEVANIAMMHLQRKDAEVVSIQPAAFEGHEAYVVDIQCKTGESYDVFVGIDGTLLGYETLQEPDIEEIEAEAAEIALKSAYPYSVRSELAKAGIAMSDGSFPILAHNDLLNAIQASKRATNQKEVREHIILRAKTIGYENSIPSSWVEITPLRFREASRNSTGSLRSLTRTRSNPCRWATGRKTRTSAKERMTFVIRCFGLLSWG